MPDAVSDNQYSDELRQQKMMPTDNARQADAGEPQSLRERVKNARNALNIKEQAKKKIEEKITSPVNMATSGLLKKAWLAAPETFGLTALYANIHVFLRWVVGDKFFCKLGREWAPGQVQALGGEAVEKFGAKIGMAEVAVLLILDLIILFIILMQLAWIFMIVDFMRGGLWKKVETIYTYWTTFSGLGWTGIKALIDLF